MANASEWEKTLIGLLQEYGFSSSIQEAQTIVEAIAEEHFSSDAAVSSIVEQDWIQSLQDYLGVSEPESRDLITKCCAAISESSAIEDGDSGDDQSSNVESENGDAHLDDDDDDTYLEPGECELCERYIRLTRHHLIPKSTWRNMETKLAAACHAVMRKNNVARAEMLVGPVLLQQHVVPLVACVNKETSPNLLSKREQEKRFAVNIKSLLQSTCEICRPCHSAIHRTHDNVSLAERYNTTELLLEDAEIFKFCKWASKQRTGKYAVR